MSIFTRIAHPFGGKPYTADIAKQDTNWNANVKLNAESFLRPTSVEELQDIVRAHGEDGVRLTGAKHSMNAGMDPDGGVSVDMTAFHHIGRVQAQADGSGRVWVGAGASLGDLGKNLAEQGWAMQQLPTSMEVTVGGGTANAAHGTNMNGPASLSDQVTGIRLVQDGGKKNEILENDPKLPIYRASLGSLGAAYEIQYKVVPNYRILERDTDKPRSIFEDKNLRAELARHPKGHAFVLWAPGSKTSQWRWGDEVGMDDKVKGFHRTRTSPLHTSRAMGVGQTIFLDMLAKLPSNKVSDRMMRATFPKRLPTVGDAWVMNAERIDHPAHDMSYAVPLDKTDAFLKDVEAAFKKNDIPVPVPFFIRFLRGDTKTLMGANFGQDITMVEYTSPIELDKNSKTAAKLAEGRAIFQGIAESYGGRAHWGKEVDEVDGIKDGFANPSQTRDVSNRSSFPEANWQEFHDEAHAVAQTFNRSRWAQKYTPAGPLEGGPASARDPVPSAELGYGKDAEASAPAK